MAVRDPLLLSKVRPKAFTLDPELRVYFDNLEALLRQNQRKLGSSETDIPITDANLSAIAGVDPDSNTILVGDGSAWTGTTAGSLAFQDTVSDDDFTGVLSVSKGGTGGSSITSAANVAARISLRA